MLIKKIELFYLRLPMTIVFETSFGKIDYRPALLVKLTDEKGNAGLGESSLLDVPISEPETSSSGGDYIIKKVAPKILNKKFSSIKSIKNFISCFSRHFPVTITGVESALLNLWAINEEISLRDLFGGKKKKISIGMSIGLQADEKALRQAVESAIKARYEHIKLKIKPGHDLKIVKFVRDIFPRLKFSVDANAAYSRKDLPLFKKMDEYGLDMIEQPFGKDALKTHADLQKQIKTPICLDESAADFAYVVQAIKMGSGRIINVKPARVGGYLEAIKIHNLCQKHKIPCWVGGRLETGVGITFNLALASLPNFKMAAEILPANSFLKEDIVQSPIIVKNGFMKVPNSASIILDESKVEKHIVSYKRFP
ncbi:MAG: o-succinylbenzoate synthase [Candidatus Magasanikbacteria bacterium]|nr:o-succinylbenzoate synthase [Candidatus Magasanikbacteria bacterium]